MSKRRKLSRRDVIKIAQVAGVGTAAVAGAGLSLKSDAAVRKTAVCRLCTMHCGTIATVRGGRIVKVEGDPHSQTRGFLCLNGHALPELVHAADRLRRPLVRRARGRDLEETDWDSALGFIAERLKDIAGRHGTRSLFVQTGWPFVRHPLVGLLQRFVHAFGSPNLATIASLCEASARMGRALTCGSDFLPDLEHARTLVLWGANPSHAAPPFAHLVGAFGRTAGKRLIVVDPVRHELASAATLHLPIRPGTDGALALALIGILVRRGLADANVIAADPDGFARLRSAAEPMTVERAAQVCGLGSADIERAADLMLERPTTFWSGLGIEHHMNGVQTVRAVSCFAALLGSLSDGAAQLLHSAADAADGEILPQLYRLATAEPVPAEASDKPIGYDTYPLFDVFNRQAHAMALPDAVLRGSPYAVRALVLLGCNPLVTFPDAALMRRVFDALELIVVIDPFLSTSARAADVVLPSATFAEATIVESSRVAAGDRAERMRRGQTIYDGRAKGEPVLEPQGDSRPDWRILFDMAAALGLERYFPWKSLEEALAAPRQRWLRDPARELLAAATPGARAYPTPSGHIELASPTMERMGHEAVPSYVPPGESPSAEYPLILVTGPRTRPYINSQLRTMPSVQRQLPDPRVRIHPETAAALGIEDGDQVEVATRVGTAVFRAEVSDTTRTDTVVLPHGWERANANTLIVGGACDPISGFPAFRYSVCRISLV